LKSLQSKAQDQLGTSGTGNHFVEWGAFTLEEESADLGLKAGQYLALLSHSGSRGVGFKIANEYSKIARDLHPRLDNVVRHLAWLPMGSEAGQEYWISMELAGRFASANHAVIHQRVADAAGLKEVAHVENHHNFAWRETLQNGTKRLCIARARHRRAKACSVLFPARWAIPVTWCAARVCAVDQFGVARCRPQDGPSCRHAGDHQNRARPLLAAARRDFAGRRAWTNRLKPTRTSSR
jgi:tRNA-splicing ligase RtcB